MKKIIKLEEFEVNEKSEFFLQDKLDKLADARDKKEQWHLIYDWIKQDVIHFNDLLRLLDEL